MTWLFLILGLVLLVFGADLLVKGAARLAGSFGVPALETEGGHAIAFHSFVRSSIGPPFTSVWHRTPEGRWRSGSS